MENDSRKRATKKYWDNHITQVAVKLRKDEDSDVINNLRYAKKVGYTSNEWLQALYDGKRLV